MEEAKQQGWLRSAHLADKHGHAQVLKAARVAVAALLHPQVRHVERLAAEALRPEQVAVALKHGDDVLVAQLRQNPLLLAPHAGAEGPGGGADARVEQRAPVVRAVLR